MEVTWALYQFVSRVLLFPSKLTYIQRIDLMLLRALKTWRESKGTCRESREDIKGLLNDAVYEKAFVFPS